MYVRRPEEKDGRVRGGFEVVVVLVVGLVFGCFGFGAMRAEKAFRLSEFEDVGSLSRSGMSDFLLRDDWVCLLCCPSMRVLSSINEPCSLISWC